MQKRTIEQLHRLVRANFAIKNPESMDMRADPMEGGADLPMLIFCHLAEQNGISMDEVADYCGITWVQADRYRNRFSDLAEPQEGSKLARKIGLINNGIRIHHMHARRESYVSQIQKRK